MLYHVRLDVNVVPMMGGANVKLEVSASSPVSNVNPTLESMSNEDEGLLSSMLILELSEYNLTRQGASADTDNRI